MLSFDGGLTKAGAKTMRYGVLHVFALPVHKSRGLFLRLDQTWPWVDDHANAFVNLRAAVP